MSTSGPVPRVEGGNATAQEEGAAPRRLHHVAGMVDSIKELYALYQGGALTEEEFCSAKLRILQMDGDSCASSCTGSSRAMEKHGNRGRISRQSRGSHGSRRSLKRKNSGGSSTTATTTSSSSSSSSSSRVSGFMVAPRAKVWLPLATGSEMESIGLVPMKEPPADAINLTTNSERDSSLRGLPMTPDNCNAASWSPSRRYGTFQPPWPVSIGGTKGRLERAPTQLLSEHEVHVEYFNCRGSRGNSFRDVKLQEHELRPPYFLSRHRGPGTNAGLVASAVSVIPSEQELGSMMGEERRLGDDEAPSSVSSNSDLEMCLNWYWVDMTGRDPSRRRYNAALRLLTRQFNITESFLTDRDHSLVLPQICTSPEAPTQFLICLRVATPRIALNDDSVLELTNRRIFVVDLAQKVVITIHRMDCPIMANMREQWKSLMEGNDISFQEFLVRILHDAVNTYDSSLDVHANLLDRCESKLFVSELTGKCNQQRSDDSDSKSRFPEGKILSLFANSSHSPFLTQLLDGKNATSMDKGAMNMFLYHLHRRTSVQYRMLNITKTVLAESFTKLRLCSKEHANQMCVHCIELIDRALEVRDDAKTLLNLHISLQSFRSNELMAVLTKFSVFFTPCSFLAAVYGMNFPHMPEFSLDYGYTLYWITCLVVCILIYGYMSKRGLLH